MIAVTPLQKEILRLHSLGLNRAQIARKAECSESTVRTVLLANGLTPRVVRDSAERDVERDRRVVSHYKRGATMKAIAEHEGVTPQRVQQILRRAGVKGRGCGSPAHWVPPGPIFGEENLFGRRLRAERVAAGLTQERLAVDCGLLRGCIQTWETARCTPNPDQLRRVCVRLRVSADYLIGLTNKQEA